MQIPRLQVEPLPNFVLPECQGVSLPSPPPKHDYVGDPLLPGGAFQEGSYSQDGVVPVDYASSKLWGVTLEYENLLNVQQEQHALGTRQMEAEVFRLRQAVQMLQTGRSDEGFAASQLKMKDEEHRLALEAKQKQIDLFSSLLRVRDRQIGDLQKACEMKVHSLDDVRSGAEAEAIAEVLREVECLRKDKAELQQLLVAKDRQISAIQSVNPQLTDTSALQLGAKAVQMFHDSMRMKAEATDCEHENQELRKEVDELQGRVEDLDAITAEKRGEIKELTSTLTGKMQRVIELETEVDALRREKQQRHYHTSSQIDSLKADLTTWQQDCRTTQQLVEDLKAELAERDQRFMKQQAECTRHEVTSQELQTKVDEMTVQLAHAEDTLSQMLMNNSYKDQLVREMTDQVNISESKLHSYQINELVGSRQRLFEKPSRDESVIETSALKASPLRRSPGHSYSGAPDRPGISQILGQLGASAASPVDAFVVETSALSGAPASTKTVEDSVTRSLSETRTTSSSGSPTPMSYFSQRRNSRPSLAEPRAVPSAAGCAAAASGSLSPLLAESYRPQPGDPVDLKVAEFTNLPQNSACKALFCRLGEGSYLYGTQMVTLHLSDRTGSLEALVQGSWIPVEDFVRQMQPSQSVHLQRAREKAGAS